MIEGSNWGTIKESGGDCATAGQGPIEISTTDGTELNTRTWRAAVPTRRAGD